MKTEEEINEQIREKVREFKEVDDKNSCMGGMTIGWIDALQWVLEEE